MGLNHLWDSQNQLPGGHIYIYKLTISFSLIFYSVTICCFYEFLPVSSFATPFIEEKPDSQMNTGEANLFKNMIK